MKRSIGSCSAERPGVAARETSAARPDDEARLLAADRAWAAAAEAGDVERVVTFWTDDAVNYLPGEPPARGRQAIIEIVGRYRSDPAYSLSWHAVSVHVAASGELGYTSGPFTMTLGDDAGTITRTGHYLCVWRKLPHDDWKCAVETCVFDTKVS